MSNRWKSPAFVASVILILGVGGLAAGCNKSKGASTTADATSTQGIPQVDPTLCETDGKNVLTYDLNRDNKPDVWRLWKTEDEGGSKVEYMTCKQVDYDHDGRKDWVVSYNRKATRLYEKIDMDYDGRFDASIVYDPKTGSVAEVERDSDFDGKYDLKEIYDTAGIISSVRLDKDGDGEPDEWEQYKDGALVAILYDDNFDGKVDRREEVPGSRPKIEMPTIEDDTAASRIPTSPATDGATGTPAPEGDAAPQ